MSRVAEMASRVLRGLEAPVLDYDGHDRAENYCTVWKVLDGRVVNLLNQVKCCTVILTELLPIKAFRLKRK